MLRIKGVSHAYEHIVSLREVSLDVETGEILCLLGPSGCGKTTLLRIIAGLEKDFKGVITFDGDDIAEIPVHLREFGLMFQDFALFPHLSVAKNIAYGLKRRGYNRSEIDRKVKSLLARVGLTGLDERDTASLSGGQKQRVALARSLAPNPRLLMLDEPLGSLDAQLRDQLALNLRQIIKVEALSAIYVTHDHREAYAVADRIAVMNVGSIQQHDTPRNLYSRPANAFVARFLGMHNIFTIGDGRISDLLGAETYSEWAGTRMILIHPAGISLERKPQKRALEIDAVLENLVFRGDHCDVMVKVTEGLSLSFAADDMTANVGETVTIYVERESIISLDD